VHLFSNKWKLELLSTIRFRTSDRLGSYDVEAYSFQWNNLKTQVTEALESLKNFST